jgi:Ca2+-binding RTX toxin-like protein
LSVFGNDSYLDGGDGNDILVAVASTGGYTFVGGAGADMRSHPDVFDPGCS